MKEAVTVRRLKKVAVIVVAGSLVAISVFVIYLFTPKGGGEWVYPIRL